MTISPDPVGQREQAPDQIEAPRQRADARRNRAAVLDAARGLFAREGIDAQMPDLARAAGVGIGTIYRHFPSKDELLAACVEAHFEHLADKLRECLEQDDPWQALAGLIRYTARIQAADRGLSEIISTRPEMVNAAAMGAGLPELTDQLVGRAQRAGTLRADLTWEDIPMIVCGLGSVTQQLRGPTTGRWPRLVEIIIDGLRAPGSDTLPPPL